MDISSAFIPEEWANKCVLWAETFVSWSESYVSIPPFILTILAFSAFIIIAKFSVFLLDKLLPRIIPNPEFNSYISRTIYMVIIIIGFLASQSFLII